MLARGSISAQKPSPSSNHDDVVGDGPDGGDDNDNDAWDQSSECGYAGSIGLHQPQEPSGNAITQQKRIVASEPGSDSSSVTHFQQSYTPIETAQDTGSFFDLNWKGAAGQVDNHQELLTPDSNCLSWFDPFKVSASTVADSWWTKSPIDEDCFHNSDPFGIGFPDMPGSSDHSRANGHTESKGKNIARGNEKKGNVTVNLSQVDPDVAQEIMGSVLKHSAILKIRCIVNDD